VRKAIDNIDVRRRSELSAIRNVKDSIRNDKYPTLKAINERAGVEGIAETIMIAHLKDFVDFCAFNEPVSEDQYTYVARIVTGKYGYLKARELLIFFAQMKGGKYGRFYGKFDPVMFIGYLKTFIEWRNMRIEEYMREDKEREYAEHKERSMDLKTFLAKHPNGEYKNLRKFFGV